MSSHRFTEIPILDLSLADDQPSKQQLLRQLHRALTKVGFLYVVNHGVPEAVVKDLDTAPTGPRQQLEKLIEESNLSSLPSWKQHGQKTSLYMNGYVVLIRYDAITAIYSSLLTGFPWPSAFPSLRPVVNSYISELTKLGERFLCLVAVTLSLPSPESLMQGVGPHKDSSGWWTFPLQASPDVSCLQVLSGDGAWIDIPVTPPSFVVNIGQVFEVVTNGVCKAATHRVMLAPGSPERFSVPFLQDVRRDLSKEEAVGTFRDHFSAGNFGVNPDSGEANGIYSPFLKGKYDTWGESQLRTKIRIHSDVGQAFYVQDGAFDRYTHDD